MLKTLFTIQNFPVNSILYRVFTVDRLENDICYRKYQVLNSNEFSLTVKCLKSPYTKVFTKNEIEFSSSDAITVPEYVYNHLHNLPNDNLTEHQQIQLVFLTGSTDWDSLIKKAELSRDEYQFIREQSD